MVQEKCGFKYQWTTDNVDVPLMHETRKGHVSSLTKDECYSNLPPPPFCGLLPRSCSLVSSHLPQPVSLWKSHFS